MRSEDWTGPDCEAVKMVYADWRNTGDRPVRRVTAKVVVVDVAGEVVFPAEGVTIFSAPPARPASGRASLMSRRPARAAPCPA
jgi:hypothetical protein